MSRSQTEDAPARVLSVVTTRHLPLVCLLCVALGLSLFVLRTYRNVYTDRDGWTKMICFGEALSQRTLPRLRGAAHYVYPKAAGGFGYDGQFYAQMALDPSLRDPAFEKGALDAPAYRARRIFLPALAFCAGGGEPRRVIQVYAVANLIFWFVLLGALAVLHRPWKGQQLLCLGVGLLGCGVLVSLEMALTDLPAAALIFVGAVIGSWGGYAALAAAALTRETSLLAAVGFLDPRGPLDRAAWKRRAGMLALAAVPLALWLIHVRWRFAGGQPATGLGNFALPLQAMGTRLAEAAWQCAQENLARPAWMASSWRWLYMDFGTRRLYTDYLASELLIIVGIVFQGLYFLLRRDVHSAYWRTGACYGVLGSVLGPAVWEEASAAARVLLPMTLCFYLRLARERAVWFWPFFILGSVSVPYAVHYFWGFS